MTCDLKRMVQADENYAGQQRGYGAKAGEKTVKTVTVEMATVAPAAVVESRTRKEEVKQCPTCRVSHRENVLIWEDRSGLGIYNGSRGVEH